MRLEVERLSAGYGGTLAIRNVTLVAPAGKVVALLGPNGAGKTTLLSAVSGLVRPRTGRESSAVFRKTPGESAKSSGFLLRNARLAMMRLLV